MRSVLALAGTLQARRLEPKSPSPMVMLGRTGLYLSRIPEAVKAAEDGLAAGLLLAEARTEYAALPR